MIVDTGAEDAQLAVQWALGIPVILVNALRQLCAMGWGGLLRRRVAPRPGCTTRPRWGSHRHTERGTRPIVAHDAHVLRV